jgi:hypothetical protein
MIDKVYFIGIKGLHFEICKRSDTNSGLFKRLENKVKANIKDVQDNYALL